MRDDSELVRAAREIRWGLSSRSGDTGAGIGGFFIGAGIYFGLLEIAKAIAG